MQDQYKQKHTAGGQVGPSAFHRMASAHQVRKGSVIGNHFEAADTPHPAHYAFALEETRVAGAVKLQAAVRRRQSRVGRFQGINSIYASTLSLNSLCDTKRAAARRHSGAGNAMVKSEIRKTRPNVY